MIKQRQRRTLSIALVLSMLISVLVATVAQGQDSRPAPAPREPIADQLSAPLTGVSPLDQRLDPALLEAEGPTRVIVRMTNKPLLRSTSMKGAASVSNALAGINAQQDAVIAKAMSLDSDVQVLGRTSRVLNAVMLSVDASAAQELSKDFNVSSVNAIADYELDLSETVPYIGATAAQDMGYDGSGIRVAVLDSGVDYTHANLGGEGTLEAYEAAYGTSNADPLNTTLDGLFPTDKVVDGFDFVGEDWPNTPEAFDPDPIDFEGHGTHVADIIGGENGVAPGVDIIGVKVCSAVSSSCSGLALILGMEFAVDPNGDFNLDDAADIINMSLGSTYGTAFDDDLSEAVRMASFKGILTVASAGNSGNNAYSTGTPSAEESALSVAQTAVPSAGLDQMEIIGGDTFVAVFQAWATPVTERIQAPVVYGDSDGDNLNGCAAFDGDMSGKIVLIDRGACTFSSKIQNVEAAGGIVGIIGLVDGSAPFSGGFGGGDLPGIPGFMITLEAANAVRAAVAAEGEVAFDPVNRLSLAGTMASTSARGPAMRTNALKPEIGAPGASLSAEAGTGTGETPFGGTSGAAPMVSGSAALVLEAYPWMRSQHVKAALMSTGERDIFTTSPALSDELAPVSRIGGGEVRVDKALTTPAIVYSRKNIFGVGLSFGQVDAYETTVIEQKLTVKNLTNQESTYDVSVEFRKESMETGAVTIDVPETVTVGPYRQKTIVVTMTIDPTLLPEWTMNNGSGGSGAFELDQMEVAGYINFDDVSTDADDDDNLHASWHVLPRKAGKIVAPTSITIDGDFDGIPAGDKPIMNKGESDITVLGYSLLAESFDKRSGARGQQSPTPDFQYIGYSGFVSSGCGAGWGFEFAINSHERQSHMLPVLYVLTIDTDLDGTGDYQVYNYDLGLWQGGGIDGRQVVAVDDLAAGTSSAFFFLNHDTNSANSILTICGEQLGFSDTSVAFDTFAMDAQAFDFYFGGPGDLETGMFISPLGSRYFPIFDGSGSTGTIIPAMGSDTLNMLDFGPGLSSDIGVLLMSYHGEEDREAKAIIGK